MAGIYDSWPAAYVAAHGNMQDGHIAGHAEDQNAIRFAVDGFAYCAALLPRVYSSSEDDVPRHVIVECQHGIGRRLKFLSKVTLKSDVTFTSELWIENGRVPEPDDHARLIQNLDAVKTQLTRQLGNTMVIKFPRARNAKCPVVFSHAGRRILAIAPQIHTTPA